jgi:hypothetical protein
VVMNGSRSVVSTPGSPSSSAPWTPTHAT